MGRFPGSKILPYFLITPSVGVILIFLIYPFSQAVWMAFHRSAPWGAGLRFVGLDNFRNLMTSPEYLRSVWLTFLFAFIVISVGLTISLCLAMLTTQKIKGSGFYQVAFIWTYAMSPAIAGVMWALLFDPSIGLLTHGIRTATGYRLNFFTDPVAAFLIVTLASIWIMLGYNMCFYIAGLQNVPNELKEAAYIDGASPWQAFWNVTFPMLSPTTAFLIFVNTIYSFFLVFGLIDVVTQGGPGQTTEFLVYRIYRDGFARMRHGPASAQSVILFIMIAAIATFQIYSTSKKAIYSR